MVPPLSVTSAWSSIRSITGWRVVAVELAGVGAARGRPASRATSMTMTWSPRHRPEAGDVVLPGVAGGGDHALDRPARRSRRG